MLDRTPPVSRRESLVGPLIVWMILRHATAGGLAALTHLRSSVAGSYPSRMRIFSHWSDSHALPVFGTPSTAIDADSEKPIV